jgi:hypothetical protein
MAKLPPHLSARLKHLPITPIKRRSSQYLFERALLGLKEPDTSKPPRPSTDDQFYWERGGTTSDPSLIGEIEDVSKAVKKAAHDVKTIAHDPSKAIPHGPFRSMAEAIDDAVKTAEQFYHQKLLRAMGNLSTGAVDTRDTWDEADYTMFSE